MSKPAHPVQPKKWKYRIGKAGKTLLAFLIVLTGIPLFPGQETPRAYADTSVMVDPATINSVYGGKTTVNFIFENPDPNDHTQKSHDTSITLEKNGSKIATLKEGRYPTLENNEYVWDGKVNGRPAAEGAYKITVTPTRFPSRGKSGHVRIINPNPPAPKGLEVVPNKSSEKHVIRGIAELGTKVELKMKRIVREGDNTAVDTGVVETLKRDIPVRPRTSAWAKKIPVDSTYFTDFPVRGDNPPSKYVGEWEAEVTLPVYEIAEIQAFATRQMDSKRSEGSETLRVLRYMVPERGINWAVVASYYYNVIEKQAIVEKIDSIAQFNGFPVEDCNNQVCYGYLDKGIQLIIMDPQIAGEIGIEDDKHIRDEFYNRNDYPLPLAFDPIDLSSGDFSFHQTNISVQAIIPLDLTLTYHSRDKYNGDFGVGWHHTYERRLEFYDNGLIYAVSPEGASTPFEPTGGGQYKGASGQYDTLVKNPDGTYKQQTPQKWSYIYRRDGKLYRMVDPNGNTVQLVYSGTLLTDVTTNGASLSLTYGDGGKVVRVTDQSGRYAAYEYDPINHDLTAMILPDGSRITYKYDKKHRMTEISNPKETQSLINVYDEENRVVRQRDFAGIWGDIEYFPSQNKTVTTDALGRKTQYFFDERHRKTATTYPDGTTERFLYDANDNMIQRTDGNGHVWTYVYDGFGNLTRAKDPEGHLTEIRYNAHNLPQEIMDPLGNKSTFGYDDRGNLTTITDAQGGVSKVVVNDRGVPTSLINAKGQTTTFDNDEFGFTRGITDPLGNRQAIERDPLHRITSMTDALGQRTTMEYDPRDRLTKRINAMGHAERFEYDKDSNLTQYVDASGAKTTYEYSSFDKMTREIDAMGGITSYAYDEVGNLISVTNPKGAVTSYAYDSADRVISVTDPEGSVTRYAYDGNGNVVSVLEPNDGETRMAYDKRNLPVSMTDAEGSVTRFSYDAAGRMTQITDPLGHTTVYTYDELGQLITETDALEQVTAYTYDAAGQLVSLKKPNGAEWNMDYDERGLLAKMTNPLGGVSSMTRDANGRVIQAVDEDGKMTAYSYDPLDRVIRMVDPLGRASEMSYDANGLLTALTDAKSQTTSFGYDALGRLLQVTNALGHRTAYGYDAIGNLVSKTDALGRVTSYEYNRRGELIREAGPEHKVTELAYDSAGNVTGITAPDGTTTSYTYDLVSRLTGIQYSDGKQVGYQYDAAGRRIQMTDDIGVTHYSYDALNRLITVKDPKAQTIQYEWTATGQRSRVVYPDGNSVGYQYDAMDRMTSVTDAQGRSTMYAYDMRGLLVSKQLPTHGISTYKYDDAGQLLQMTHRNQFEKILEQLTYTYDAAGNRIRIERLDDDDDDEDDSDDHKEAPEWSITDYAYDALNQLVRVATMDSDDLDQDITSYSYDAVGNRVRMEHVDDVNDKGDHVRDDDDDADDDKDGPEQIISDYAYNALDQLVRVETMNLGIEEDDDDDITLKEIKEFSYDRRGNMLNVVQKRFMIPGMPDDDDDDDDDDDFEHGDLDFNVPNAVYKKPPVPSVTDMVYKEQQENRVAEWTKPKVIEQYMWDGANRLLRHMNNRGDVTKYAYDGDGNRVKMTLDYAHGGNDRDDDDDDFDFERGKSKGKGKGKCHVVPPGFIPPGLIDKCDEEDDDDDYPDMHPGGPRDGWEKQYKKKHWELNFTNDVSLALPEPIQVTEADSSKWKQTYVYGAGGERISMDYLPAYDANNGWEPSPGVGGAKPGTESKTLWYMQDALGSVLGLVDKDGRMSARYSYDEFGIPEDRKKFDLNWPGPDNLFGYTGLGYDYTSSQTYARARYYEPEIGRFVSEDTYKGDIWTPQSQNLYTYVHNNPLKFIDLSGNKPSPLEAAYMAQAIYSVTEDDVGGTPLRGGWILKVIHTNDEGLKMGVYTRFQYGVSEYALVNEGTSSGVDWKNNIFQPIGFSADMKDSIKYAKEFVKKYSDYEVTMVGHSKGGAEATANALATNTNAITFNPAPVNLKSNGLYLTALIHYNKTIMHYIVTGDILTGILGKPIGKAKYLPTQHKIYWYNSSIDKIDKGIKNHSIESVINALIKEEHS